MKVSTINRFFNVAFGAIAMIAVALFSAYIAMRVAIHGREVKVPNLAGLSMTDAEQKAKSLGLRLNVENSFYSAAVPAGTVIAQTPPPGITVRREWTVRLTESLGSQQVAIPNLVGLSERPATITLRRLGLELGAVARIPSPGPTGIVLAQTPAATDSTSGINSPRVSLLLSAPEPDPTSKLKIASEATAEPAAADSTAGFEMPSLVGLTLPAAVARAKAVGLHIVSAEEATAAAPAAPATTPATTPANPTPVAAATVVAQSPPAGQQVLAGAPVKITLGRP